MITIPDTVTVLIDTREKRPLLFPDTLEWFSYRTAHGKLVKIVKEKVRMSEGDYTLKGFESVALVERKGSLDEVAKNLMTHDRARAVHAFERMAKATKYPYLLLDMSPMIMATPTRRTPDPARVFDALMNVVSFYGLRIWFSGNCRVHRTRRLLGEQIIRVLMAHCYRTEPVDSAKINEVLRNVSPLETK